MLTLISIQNSSAHQVWPRIPYTYMRIRSLRDQASRSDQIRSSESDDAIPDPDPDPMIGSFDPNHNSTALPTPIFTAREHAQLEYILERAGEYILKRAGEYILERAGEYILERAGRVIAAPIVDAIR